MKAIVKMPVDTVRLRHLPIITFRRFYMKRLAVLLLAAMMLSACSSASSSQSVASAPAPSSSSSSSSNASSTTAAGQITIQLPARIVQGLAEDAVISVDEYISQFKTKYNLIDAVFNDDGSVTVTMNKAEYEALLATLRESVTASIATIAEGKLTSIKEITYNDELTEFKVTVDRKSFEGEGNLDTLKLLAIYRSSALYQVFNGNKEPAVVFNIFDAATGEQFLTLNYPADLKAE